MGMEPIDKIFSRIDLTNISENISKTKIETDKGQNIDCKICENFRWILSENKVREPCQCQEQLWGTNTKIRIVKIDLVITLIYVIYSILSIPWKNHIGTNML